jgi:GNAT superfamily N-acetyltransferase
MLASTHELADGSRVRLRLTRPNDLAKIEAFLPDREVRHFAFYDPRERLTLAATMPSDGGEEIAGIAEVPLGDDAEQDGILVAGNFRGRGLGSLLSEAAASIAARRRNAA